MATWDELDNKDNSDKDKGETNMALIALTSSDTGSESGSGSEYEEEDEVFFILTRSHLISCIQYLMCRCQDKAKHMKILKNHYDLLKEELNSYQNKIESLERDHIAQVNKVLDKPLSEHEISFQDFIMTGFGRTKISSMIYGVSKSKGGGMGYKEKGFTPKDLTLQKPSDPYSSSIA